MATCLSTKIILFTLALSLADCILDRSYYEALGKLINLVQKSQSVPVNNKSDRPLEDCLKNITLIEIHNQGKNLNKSTLVKFPIISSAY